MFGFWIFTRSVTLKVFEQIMWWSKTKPEWNFVQLTFVFSVSESDEEQTTSTRVTMFVL